MPRPVLNVTLASLVIMNIIGVFVSARMNTYRRQQYLAQQQEGKLLLELERMANTDSLTGLLNRRRFIEALETEFSRFKRHGEKFAVMMGDLDHFKAINDQFGHPTGDEVLKQFSRIASETLRTNDVLGRLGGEEFCVLLPHTTTDSGMIPAERIRQSCGAISIQTDKGLPAVSMSIGLTEVQAADQSADEVLQRADQALYLAKSKGRNRCEVT